MGKSSNWYRRHTNDAYVKKAKAEGKRSRAAFKLTEIMSKHDLLPGSDAVIVDLGCAPGSWCQELAAGKGEKGMVIGVDVLPMEPLSGVQFIQLDFSASASRQKLEEVLSGRKAHLVVSDMAPEMSGNKLVDQASMINLNEITFDFAVNHLRDDGNFLLKTFMGDGFDTFRRDLTGFFRKVKVIKPAASRSASSEIFLLAKSFCGRGK
ncbi:MAG: RlmE family RNA methyltransferase [Mariprofundaceae bacterium]